MRRTSLESDSSNLAVIKRDALELEYEEPDDPDNPMSDFVDADDSVVYEDGTIREADGKKRLKKLSVVDDDDDDDRKEDEENNDSSKRKLPDRKAKQDVLPSAVKEYVAAKSKAQKSKPSDLLPPPEDKEEYKTKPWNGDLESDGDDNEDDKKKKKKKGKDTPSDTNGDDKLKDQLKAAESYSKYLDYDGKTPPEAPEGKGYEKLWDQLKHGTLKKLAHWMSHKLAVGAMKFYSYLPDYDLEGSHPTRKPQPSVYDKAFSRWRVMYLKHAEYKKEQERAASRPMIQRTVSGIHSSSPSSSPPPIPIPSSSFAMDPKLDLLLSRTHTPSSSSNGITMKSSSSSKGKQWNTNDIFEFGVGMTGKNVNGVRYGLYRIHLLGKLGPTVKKPLSISTKEVNQEHYSTCLFLGVNMDDKKKFLEISNDYSLAYRQSFKGEAINRLELFVIPDMKELTPAPLCQDITNRTESRKGNAWTQRWTTIQDRDDIQEC